jgi:hypothetical protein
MIKIFAILIMFCGILIMGSAFTSDPVFILGAAIIGFATGLIVTSN